ncbi:hypothetical protein CEXT_149721 [Caerostris extrusa]|uniref:Uncharacterized protein n=1 Tax=Caerostris extrusa TaxID=172846 RepID=A0AAV4QRP9_CAEEX|nr:hypothetical protein CEXT_149721 [Caerostris extrusa]
MPFEVIKSIASRPNESDLQLAKVRSKVKREDGRRASTPRTEGRVGRFHQLPATTPTKELPNTLNIFKVNLQPCNIPS